MILITLSIVFMWSVLKQFQSKDSSYKEYEIPIQEGPTITLCFNQGKELFMNQSIHGFEKKRPSPFMYYYLPYEIGIDFNISYSIRMPNYGEVLTFGENVLENHTITVWLEKYVTYFYQICYGITSSYNLIGKRNSIVVSFNKSIPSEEIPIIDIDISSASNSYGITLDKYFDGRISQIDFPRELENLGVQLKTEKRINSNSKTPCRKESFYECFENRFLKNGIGKCINFCSPISLPNNKIHLCMNLDDMKCANEIFLKVFQNITRNECPRPCESIGYSVQNQWMGQAKNTHLFRFVYEFLINEHLQVYEEYLIYDTISLVGSVGGTLGIFVGFSLKDFFSKILNIIQNHLMNHCID